MKSSFRASTIIAVAIISIAQLALAGVDDKPTPRILHLSPNVRAASLGYSGVADWSDAGNIFNNPAAVLGASHLTLLADRLSPTDSTERYEITVASRLPMPKFMEKWFFLAGALGYSAFDFKTQSSLTEQPDPKEGDYYIHGTLGLGLRIWVLDVGAGLSGKRVTAESTGENQEFYSWDAGANVALRVGRTMGFRIIPSVGVTIPHLGIEADSLSKPETVRVGARVRIESKGHPRFEAQFGTKAPLFALTVSADVVQTKEAEDASQVGLGAEISSLDFFAVRVGYRETREGNQLKSFGLGMGPQLDHWMGRFNIVWTDIDGTDGFGIGGQVGYTW